MPQYYPVEKVAEMLGVSVDEVKRMQERRELHGYRDGANWKFKAEDIERMAKERRGGKAEEMEEGQSDVLLSDVSLGGSNPGLSGTIIGPDLRGPGSSEVKLGLGKGAKETTSGIRPKAAPMPGDSDLTLGEDEASSASAKRGPGSSGASGKSAVDLSKSGDDDLVLGGSGSGSDVTIGSDSGISLVDPADSGLSLEEPLQLPGGAAEESLELGEEDMLAGEEQAAGKGDDDFLLTPLPEASDEEDSSSGSQVIALDAEGAADEGATLIGAGAMAPMTPMLDEDLSGPTPLTSISAAASGAAPGLGGTEPVVLPSSMPTMMAGEMAGAMEALPEAPYTGLDIALLVVATLALIPAGMMIYDLIRNMWSWGGAMEFNSRLMDWVLHLFEK